MFLFCASVAAYSAWCTYAFYQSGDILHAIFWLLIAGVMVRETIGIALS